MTIILCTGAYVGLGWAAAEAFARWYHRDPLLDLHLWLLKKKPS